MSCRGWTCVVALVGLFFGGCGYSVCPLSSVETSEVDPDLFGTWEWEDDDEDPVRLYVGRKGDSRTLHEVVSVEVQKGQIVIERFDFRATAIGSDRYVSVRLPLPKKKQTKCIKHVWGVARYTVKDDRLHIEPLDTDRAVAAIKAGDIKGQVDYLRLNLGWLFGTKGEKEPKEDDGIPFPILTAKTPALRAWLAGSGRSCFAATEDSLMRRIGAKR